VVTAADGVAVSDYAEAGATWLIESIWPHPNGWYDELRAKCAAGPPR
jgi:hypothetical protein